MIFSGRLRRSLLLAGCLITLTCAGCGGAPASSQVSATPTPAPTAIATATYTHLLTPRYPVTMRSDVAYGSAPLEQLDLCQPGGVTSSQLPGIVLIHGGS